MTLRNVICIVGIILGIFADTYAVAQTQYSALLQFDANMVSGFTPAYIQYDNSTGSTMVGAGVNAHWNRDSINDYTSGSTQCLIPKAATGSRGKIIYNEGGAQVGCPETLNVACYWSISQLYAAISGGLYPGATTTTGNSKYSSIGMSKNGIVETDADIIYFTMKEGGLSDGDPILNTTGFSGMGEYSLSQDDYVALHFLGYTDATTDFLVGSFLMYCEQTGASGQIGNSGAIGHHTTEFLHTFFENPVNGTLSNVHRTASSFPVNGIYCKTDQGTVDLDIIVDDGSPQSFFKSVMTCGSPNESSRLLTDIGSPFTGNPHGGNIISNGSYLDFVFSNVTGSPNRVTITGTRVE